MSILSIGQVNFAFAMIDGYETDSTNGVERSISIMAVRELCVNHGTALF